MGAFTVDKLDTLLERRHGDGRIAHINVEAGRLLGKNLSVRGVYLDCVLRAAILDPRHARIDEDRGLIAVNLIELDLRLVVDSNLAIVRKSYLGTALGVRIENIAVSDRHVDHGQRPILLFRKKTENVLFHER